MSQPVAIGMDICGTLVRVGAFDGEGQLLGQKESVLGSIGPEDGLRFIEQLIRETLASIPSPTLLGIGIGCTGLAVCRRGDLVD